MIRFGSVCSGIEAASIAWHRLGWRAAWLAEIEPFPCAVLAHHYPDVPNLGDMTKIAAMVRTGAIEAPDIFCGGTPCQAFSVAGLRKSLDDARGNLSLTFCEIANEIDSARHVRGEQPAIVFWENVPGVLNTKDNAFGCFLAGLAGEDDPLVAPGGKWTNAGCVLGPKRAVAWRVLDAQYFGVAQRRRRVFVVASARNDFDPCAVLFESDSLRRDTAPSREARQVSPTIPARSTAGGGLRTDFDCDGGVIQAFGGNNQSGPIDVATTRNACASASGRMDFESETFLVQHTHTLRGEGFDASEDGTGRGTPSVHINTHPVAFQPRHYSDRERMGGEPSDVCHTLSAQAGQGDSSPHIASNMQVRRLTPTECEFLQGFPRGYTAIPWRKKPASECPDGPRYKALGNSWAVPNVRWIGQRIDAAVRRLR